VILSLRGYRTGTHGEPDPALALDSLMIRAASLRSKSIIVINQANKGITPIIRYEEALKAVLVEAQLLGRLFAEWAKDIPQNWKLVTHKSPGYDDKKLSLDCNLL